MTIEEHIENLKAIASDMPSDKCSDWIESLMAGVKALEQEHILEKPYIKGNYYDGFKNGLRTAKWRYDKIMAEIEAICCTTVGKENDGAIILHDIFKIIDEYKAESEDKK